jgi:GNAT superfamily N-acetyltransferase
MAVHLAETDSQILACFPVLGELRPHLVEAQFLARIRRQMAGGYALAAVAEGGRVVAVAGFRILEGLAWGKYLYVDDLVTAEAARSRGHGKELLDWLIAQAESRGCAELHLDSGVQRFAAHRFYLRERLDITSHHFQLKLK